MSKGFTLVEVVASIVILAVVMGIGIRSYQKISNEVKEQQYQIKITYIETQAEKYASEHGYSTTTSPITVNLLVELGYLTADNQNGEVLNPVNDESLNNHLIYIEQRPGNMFYAHYTDNLKEEEAS